MSPLDLNDLAVFVRVVDLAGFARAAREMRVPTSTVSRAIARLETALGARLVQRTTRSVTPTAEGRSFYAEVAPAVATLHEAARQVDGADHAPRGHLRITAPLDLASFVAGVLIEFVQKYPKVTVDVELTSRYVNLVQEGFDVALRASPKLPDSTLIAKKISEAEAGLYVSTAYARAHGVPTTLAEVADHPCILFRGRDGQAEWILHGPDGAEERVTVRGALNGDDFTFVRAAALADGGIAVLPMFLAADDVASGALMRILPAYTTLRGSGFHVVYAGGAKTPAKVVAFRDFVIAAFQEKIARAANPVVHAPAEPDAKSARKRRA